MCCPGGKKGTEKLLLGSSESVGVRSPHSLPEMLQSSACCEIDFAVYVLTFLYAVTPNVHITCHVPVYQNAENEILCFKCICCIHQSTRRCRQVQEDGEKMQKASSEA